MKVNVLKSSLIAVAVTAMLGMAAPVRASILLPGTTTFPDSVTLTGSGAPAGTLVASMTSAFDTQPLEPAEGTTGTLYTAVYRTIADTLDFYYQIAVTGGAGGEGVYVVSFSSFTGFITDVFVRTDDPDGAGADFTDGTVTPITTSRTSTGSLVAFNFSLTSSGTNKIEPGTTSDVLVIRTDASKLQTSLDGASITNGGTDNVDTFEPVPGSQVPEPGSMILLGTGLLGMATALRRKRQSA